MEFEASLQYMLMAAQFSQDTYNLPGVAGFFWASADEERGHGKEFINYLRMRGYDGNDFLGTDPIQPILKKYSWPSVNEYFFRMGWMGSVPRKSLPSYP